MKISAFSPRLIIALFIVIIAAVPSRVCAQSFPPPDGMKDFSDTMIETPNTAMVFDPSDIPLVQAEASYPGEPATVQPETPDTLPRNYDGPIGVTGVIDNVTTGCSYSPLSHNALRGPITDIDVPGALGKYGLKMRRYYNSRSSQYWDASIDLSPGWFHEYSWLLWSDGYKVVSSNGNIYDFYCAKPVGASEGWDDGNQRQHAGGGIWRLSDGGRVHFSAGRADYIEDPYGLRTTITLDPANQYRVSKVTEPGGRYLQFTYGTTAGYIDPAYGNQLLKTVQAYDGQGHLIETVTYTYTNVDSGGIDPLTGRHIIRKMLTNVGYADGTSASYGYRTDNVPNNLPSTFKFDPLLDRCNDKRYDGPMRDIAYEYQNLGPHGAISKEYKPNGPLVSKIEPDLPLHPAGGSLPYEFTETRGDGPQRTFSYTHFDLCQGDECGPCTDYQENNPPQQMLDHYTDFQEHSTQLHYNPNWYIDKVTDANGNSTLYERGNPPSQDGIGEIKKITHPGGNYIQYTYQPESGALDGHYITQITDENTKITMITRDSTRHWITRIDYPGTPAAYETFQYDDFGHGQVKSHRLKNGAYVHYRYDPRGLLIDKWEPTTNPAASDAEPHTHYDYYTAADGKAGWIDRVKKETRPANWLGYVATETYEYDIAAGTQACAGRGLVTKITHTDGWYQAFRYDQWGNKRFEWNELGEHIEYVYDSYNRVKSVTRATETTTYDYAPTEGGQSYLHTSNSPYWVTSPTAVKTHNIYDENWRKTSSKVANNTPTTFDYDNVGNLRFVTDPNGHATETDYDPRNRKWHVWNALRQQTTFTYDGASNLTYITRPDTSIEQKGYDAMNRVVWDIMPYKSDPVLNLVTSFEYNPSGTIHKVTLSSRDGTDPNPDHWTTFSYDESDRRKTMTYQNNQTQSWAYDDAGNMESRTTVNGETLFFAYDNRNRKYGESWWDVNAEWRYFGLDAASRIKRATNGIGLWWTNFVSDVHRDYSPTGRLTIDRQDLDGPDQGLAIKDVKYEYDVTLRGTDGSPTRMYVPGANYDYDFRYDDIGRFEKILPHGNQNIWFQYYYDAASNEIERFNWRNHVAQNYTPNALNRITYREVKNTTTGATLAFDTYTYDGMNRLRTVTREDNKQDQFYYYLDGELYVAFYGVTGTNGPDLGASPPAEDPAKEKTPEDFLSLDSMQPDYTQTYNRAVTYVYDKAGNRTWLVDTVNGNKAYTPNTINQYDTVQGSTIANGPEHEVASYQGPTDAQPTNYTYEKDEHLIKVASGSNVYDLAYDALGRCVKRTVKGVTKYYIYDGERPILEYNPAGALIGQNTYGKGIDEILMRWDPTITDPNLRTFYYQQDHEGSVTHLTNYNNGSGQVIEKYRYDVFGAPTIMAPGGAGRQASLYSNRFLFTGREWSAMFGFYEYRARAYHPGLGRFMSEDPKLFVRSAGLGKAADDWSFAAHPDEAEFNLFRYCDNDPIDFTDPMGEAPEWLHTTLDVSGTIEPTPFSDAINAGLYASEGNWANAGISIAGVIPYVGDIGKGGRLGGKLVKGLERAAQTTSRTKTERLLEHLTTRDLQGALKEARTGQAQGGQHLKEVAEAMHGLGKRIQQIKSSLSRGKLSEQQTQALQKELSEASKRLDNAEKYLGGTPPIQLK